MAGHDVKTVIAKPGLGRVCALRVRASDDSDGKTHGLRQLQCRVSLCILLILYLNLLLVLATFAGVENPIAFVAVVLVASGKADGVRSFLVVSADSTPPVSVESGLANILALREDGPVGCPAM